MWLDLLIKNASKHNIIEIIQLAKGNNGRCHRAECDRIGVKQENKSPRIWRNNSLRGLEDQCHFNLSVCWNTSWWSRIFIIFITYICLSNPHLSDLPSQKPLWISKTFLSFHWDKFTHEEGELILEPISSKFITSISSRKQNKQKKMVIVPSVENIISFTIHTSLLMQPYIFFLHETA